MSEETTTTPTEPTQSNITEEVITSMSDEQIDQAMENPSEDAESEPQKKEVVSKEEPPKQEEPSELDKLKKMHEDSQAMIRRQADELGQLRKLAEKMYEKPTAPEDFNLQFAQDPKTALENFVAERDQQAELRRFQMSQMERVNEDFISKSVPEFKELLGDVAELANKEGFNPQAIEEFKANPYTSDPLIVLRLAEKARYNKQLRSLTEKISALEKKPDEVLSRIEQTANRPKGLSKATSTNSRMEDVEMSEAEIAQLTPDQLDKYLKELGG